MNQVERDYLIGMQIKDVKPYYRSWKDLYQCICKQYGILTPPKVFDWYAYNEPDYMPFDKKCKITKVYWRLSLDYIKARMWDESKNLSYEMDEELAHIGYCVANDLISNRGGSYAKFGEWLKNLSNTEKERIYHEKYK